MKIGFVLDDTLDKPDGVQQYILTLGHWLRADGHDVHYLVGETHRTDVPKLHSLSRNVSVDFNGNRMSIPRPAAKAPIRHLVTKRPFDVLHVQMPYSPMLGGRIITAAPASTAVVGTFHVAPYSWKSRMGSRALRFLEWRSLRRLDAVVSVSGPAQRMARKSMRLRSQVIPNAVPVLSFETAKPIKKYRDYKINIVFLGRLVERKGCRYLLEALDELHKKKQLTNVRVLIAGTGPEAGSLEEYVASHQLGKLVHFLGFVSELEKPSLLASAHLAVFPSTGGESFGIVLIEAMAAGADVVLGGRNAGYRSILGARPEQLIQPKNTKAFAKRLQHFIANARARQRAKRWQQEIVDQYDVRVVGPQLLAVYEQAIAKRSSD